eukprot:3348597-Rhodomonas_salina.1
MVWEEFRHQIPERESRQSGLPELLEMKNINLVLAEPLVDVDNNIMRRGMTAVEVGYREGHCHILASCIALGLPGAPWE